AGDALRSPFVLGDTQELFRQEAFSPVRAMQTAPGLDPMQGAPGTRFRISGDDFQPFTPVESITLGGVEILGSRTVNTDGSGRFTVADLTVPDLEAGTYPVIITVGTGSNETTAVVSFKVTGQASVAVGIGMAPLTNADNLERVFLFDNLTKAWQFFDPRPAFASVNTLTTLDEKKIYWLKIKRDQVVTLNGKQWDLTCINEGTPRQDCWNTIVW
ncbi:MAG: hypothetical protein ACE5Q6_26155, partial [Dehalococcoidia bacterium]